MEVRMMRMICLFFMVLFPLMWSNAGPSHSEKALWIETREHGKLKSVMAVTEAIARHVVKSEDTEMNFGDDDKDLITKEMILDVLDGRERKVTAKDSSGEEEVTLYMKDLEVPGRERDKDRLILTTFKEGKKTFSVTLPDIEVESKEERSDSLESYHIGWKAFLPFVAKHGGALYTRNYKDDTEVWLYVE